VVEAPDFEVYAVRYAHREARRDEHFYGHDPHEGPMPMDYFVWAAASSDHTVVVDTGFSAEVAARRGREHLRRPAEGLEALGIDCARVPLVVLTHLHYDHIGNLENFRGKVRFVAGNQEIVPGIEVYRAGGHSAGLQVVRAKTERGNVLLASDATHFYANIGEDRPYGIVSDLAQMYGAFDLIRSLADSPDHVVPGHDPLVMQRFPPARAGLEGVAVRIA
jgi:glyoxylase-like metal-dependent hydrolase (beta-lactamase superfamily II)